MTITAIRPKIFPTESPELKELFDKRSQLTDQISALDRSILAAAHKTPAYSFIKGISGGGNIPVGIIEPQGHIAYELNAYSWQRRQEIATSLPSRRFVRNGRNLRSNSHSNAG